MCGLDDERNMEDGKMFWWNKLENYAEARGVEKCQELVFTVTTFTLAASTLITVHTHITSHVLCAVV